MFITNNDNKYSVYYVFIKLSDVHKILNVKYKTKFKESENYILNWFGRETLKLVEFGGIM